MENENILSEPKISYKVIKNIKNLFTPIAQQRIFFACHPDDFDPFFSIICSDISNICTFNCNIWYIEDMANSSKVENLEYLFSEINLFIFPVTKRFLESDNDARELFLPFAISYGIPVLPIIVEQGVEKLFNEKCGYIHFLDRNHSAYRLYSELASSELDFSANKYFDFYTSYESALQFYINQLFTMSSSYSKAYMKEAERVREAFQPHTFFSYRKKNRILLEILMQLIHNKEAFRDIGSWYDEALVPGEEFTSSIQEAIETCSVVILVVTPDLLEENNYVLEEEYPAAQKAGKTIIPIEMAPLTSEEKDIFEKKYKDIPDIIDAHDEELLSQVLYETFNNLGINVAETDNSPTHLCLIGHGYLSGIYVEKNPTLGIQLLTNSAERGCNISQGILFGCYLLGVGVDKNEHKAVEWCAKAAEQGDPVNQYYLGFCYDKGIGIEQDKEKGEKWISMAAENGFDIAQCYLGMLYGIKNSEKDYKTAAEWYTRAADQGVAFAQLSLGLLYLQGTLGEKDVETGISWLEKAAYQGSGEAQLFLGHVYSTPLYGMQNDKKAVDWYIMAAEHGQNDAEYRLGIAYSDGDLGVEKNLKMALDSYTRAAEGGHVLAQRQLGEVYLNGLLGVGKDPELGAKWLTNAAKQGNPDAQINLGACYKNGTGVEQDYGKAKKLFIASANHGCKEAIYNLGVFYYYGLGEKRNYEQAAELFAEAANKYDRDALYALGICYYFGQGVQKDDFLAKKNWETAAKLKHSMASQCLKCFFPNQENENSSKRKRWIASWLAWYTQKGFPEMQTCMGLCYLYGWGKDQSFDKAMELFQTAAAQGDAAAQHEIAKMYYNGEGKIEQDYDKAIEWYEISADNGNVGAQRELAQIYYFGTGVEQNIQIAIKWYTKGADQGDAASLTNLGVIYFKGEGVPQNHSLAKRLLLEACKKDFAAAYYNLGIYYLEQINQKDPVKTAITAADLFIKARVKGYTEESGELGVCTEILKENASKHKKAVIWLKKTANQDVPEAQYELGICFFNGYGVQKDVREAIKSWSKAAAQGYEKAIEQLKDDSFPSKHSR